MDTVRIGYLLMRETLESSGMLFPKRLQALGIDPLHFHMLIDFWERYVVGTWNVWDGRRFAAGVRAAAETHFDPDSGRMMESDLFNTANAVARVSESLSAVYDETTHGLGRLSGVLPTLKEGVATGMDAVGSALAETRGVVFNASGWAASMPNTSMPDAHQNGTGMPAPTPSNTSLAHRPPSALASLHRSRTTREFEERMARNMRRLHWIVDGGNRSVVNEGCKIVDVVFQELWAGLVAVGDYYTHNFPGSIVAFRRFWAEPDEPAQFALPPKSGRAAGTDTSVCGTNMTRDNVSDVDLALDENGKFLALRVRTLCNLGAYLTSDRTLLATFGNLGSLAGVYTTPNIHVRVHGMFTHTVATATYRGAGRPEASYLVEGIIDRAAAETGIDRVELRRR
ncbi:MAG TPA: hypothetical protein EYP98_03770, partial [Planctomycetes bacterium]|nr:hypothetical protein [Planctomycetota bacterium]